MSHWAEINEDNKVIRVLVGDNEASDEGESFMKSLGGTWVKTSFNGTIRKNFASIGYSYDLKLDAFIPPKCHTEATLNKTTCLWNCTNAEHKRLTP